MFKITSTRPVTWPDLALVRGDNVFPSRKSVPAELWPKLERFRSLGILAFDSRAEGEAEGIVLAELSEQQLYQMDKGELSELAKANGIALGDDAKKKDLLDALVAKLPKPAPAPAVASADATPSVKRGGKRPDAPPSGAVTIE